HKYKMILETNDRRTRKERSERGGAIARSFCLQTPVFSLHFSPMTDAAYLVPLLLKSKKDLNVNF
ncbi:MAG: hypothetical protein Q4C25_07445, partial [Bacillota bacterium]|nr:hypothetical protein [Bacillota bacterium]